LQTNEQIMGYNVLTDTEVAVEATSLVLLDDNPGRATNAQFAVGDFGQVRAAIHAKYLSARSAVMFPLHDPQGDAALVAMEYQVLVHPGLARWT
jgi:hypothetical protein